MKLSSLPLPDFVEPMKAQLVESRPPGDWIYEIKFDGHRALALRGGSETRVVSRNQNDLAKKFTNTRDPIAALNVQDAILDYAASGIINDRVLNIQSSAAANTLRNHELIYDHQAVQSPVRVSMTSGSTGRVRFCG